MSHYKAIVFDMDGVLVDSEPHFLDALNTLLIREGAAPITEQENKTQLLGTTVDETWQRIIAMRGLPRPLDAYVADYDPVVRQVLQDEMKPQPGVLSLISAIRERNLKAAVASSSLSSWVELKLGILGLSDAFDFYLGGDDVENGKPNPDIYLLAASKLGLEPAQCIAIEDSPPGISAAVDAGMYTIAVLTDYTRELDLSRANTMFDSLEQFDLSLLGSTNVTIGHTN